MTRTGTLTAFENLDSLSESAENKKWFGQLGLRFWYIYNPGQGGATVKKKSLCVFFLSTPHMNTHIYIYFVQILIFPNS